MKTRLIEIGGFCFASLVAGCGNNNSGSAASGSGSSSAGESSGASASAGTSGETSGSTSVSTGSSGAVSGASAGSSASGATTDAGLDAASSEAGPDGALSDASSDAALGDAATATILDPTTCVTIGDDAQACGTPQSYGGKTYAQWSATWWTWVLELPGPDFPPGSLDYTSAFCATGQSTFEDGGLATANVFFLANTWVASPTANGNSQASSAVRSCTIPANQMLFFPLAMWYEDNSGATDGGLFTDAELEALCSDSAANVTALTLEVDGVSFGSKVSDFAPYLTVRSQFSYTIPNTPQNICYLGFCDGTEPWSGPVPDAWEGGYWILLAPLPAGQHTIHFTQGYGFTFPVSYDVTYNLTVQ